MEKLLHEFIFSILQKTGVLEVNSDEIMIFACKCMTSCNHAVPF